MNTWVVLDFFGIVSGITACFIRLGNLMNSEIIGKVTDVPWAFIFYNVDDKPRHPGQLYEAIAYLIIFLFIYPYIGSILRKWVQDFISDSVLHLSSPSVSSLNTQRRYRKHLRQVCQSIWDRY